VRAAQSPQPVLEDQRADRRQLPLLVEHRIADRLLRPVKAMPATRARLGQMLKALIHPIGRRHLAVLALMPRLTRDLRIERL